ncbi:MAG: hypothetical protein OXK78_05695 [Caldilineaceae bacterium]|nr:hypothetical protein [Caldilineaceae bacterium]
MGMERRISQDGAGGGGVVAVPEAAPPVHAGRRQFKRLHREGKEMAELKETIRSKLDLYDRLNSTTSVEQIRNARSVVERLRDDRWR